MSARKLSESEKKEILKLYRETSETSSSLANQYGVSTSTISRLLKSTLPADEYESLIQQKRAIRLTGGIQEAGSADSHLNQQTTEKQSDLDQLDLDLAPAIAEESSVKPPSKKPTPKQPSTAKSLSSPQPSKTSNSSKPSKPSKPVAPPQSRSKKPVIAQTNLDEDLEPIAGSDLEDGLGTDATAIEPTVEIKNQEAAEVLKEILSDSLLNQDEEEEDDLAEADDLEEEDDLDDLDDIDGEGEFDDDDELEAGSLSSSDLLLRSGLRRGAVVQILPLTDAPIPRTCYLVVDRSAELIAPPLKDFGDLGSIPQTETQAKTLPVFDNHRVAKRYSNPRTQRVIKLPDGRVLPKASPHLQAKGITRVLIDGRVYSL